MAHDLHRLGEFQKALHCIRKAAELVGFGHAHFELSYAYYLGNFNGFRIEKSMEKAKDFGQKGTDKGNAAASLLC